MEALQSETTVYHIPDLKKYSRCPLLYWKDAHSERLPYQSFVRLDETITDLAAEKLHVQDAWHGSVGDDPSLALSAMQDHDWLMKARFQYGGLRIKVPFLHRVREGWDLYFLFAGLYPHADDMQFYCDTVWVLEHLNIQLHDIRILHLNSAYERGEELDCEQLFVLSDSFYNTANHPSVKVMDAIAKNMQDPSVLIAGMHAMNEDNLPSPIRRPRCAGRQKCRFYEECFGNEVTMPDNSILTLTGARDRYAMLREGRKTLKEADPERIEGSRQQYAEIMADKQGGLYFDRMALQTWLSDFQYPITFLDFEWERYAIPPYKGMKPYDVLPFEYSIYILKEDGTTSSNVFLSWHDDRRELVESLLRDMPKQGTVVAYNAEGAEKIRIAEFAASFPEYSDALLAINARMKDLQLPFTAGIVYDTRMAGVWTLKKIMSMMNDRSYNDLIIHQGMDAVFQWRHLDREEHVEDEDQIIEELKAYCLMDSYAACVVLKWLMKIAYEADAS